MVDLHLAEYYINQNQFSEGVRALRRAKRSLSQSLSRGFSDLVPIGVSPYWSGLLTTTTEGEGSATTAVTGDWSTIFDRRIQSNRDHLQSNVYALLGVCQFRDDPSHPEYSLSLLEEGLSLYPRSTVLLLCSGEVHSQCGDMVKAIKHFQTATKLEPGHPLPWVNAGRTYQQLGQLHAATNHVKKAVEIDPSLAMTRVDLAQLLRQSECIDEAVQAIDAAMELAKQVSEIRDVLTARYVVLLQQSLKKKGLYNASISL